MTKNPFLAIALFVTADAKSSSQNEDKQNLLREFALSCTYTIVGFFAVTKSHLEAGIKHAIDQCVVGAATMIIFDEPVTLFLTEQELLSVIDKLIENRLTIAFAQNGSIFDSSELRTMREIFLSSKKADILARSRKIKRSLILKKRRGQQLGGKKFGSGVGEANIIRQILKFHKDGYSLQKICELLAMNDVKTLQQKNWHPTTIKRIIERTKEN